MLAITWTRGVQFDILIVSCSGLSASSYLTHATERMVFLEEAPVIIGRAKHLDSDNRGIAEVACRRATATAIFH